VGLELLDQPQRLSTVTHCGQFNVVNVVASDSVR
jgi:hypothetical protein